MPHLCCCAMAGRQAGSAADQPASSIRLAAAHNKRCLLWCRPAGAMRVLCSCWTHTAFHSEASQSCPDAGQPVQRARSAAGGAVGGWQQGRLEKGPSGAGGSAASPHMAAYHKDSCSTGCHQIHEVTELRGSPSVPLQYQQSDQARSYRPIDRRQHFDHALLTNTMHLWYRPAAVATGLTCLGCSCHGRRSIGGPGVACLGRTVRVALTASPAALPAAAD